MAFAACCILPQYEGAWKDEAFKNLTAQSKTLQENSVQKEEERLMEETHEGPQGRG